MKQVFIGNVQFSLEVPYALHFPELKGEAVPLLVALHGKGDGRKRFQVEAMQALPAGWALLVPSAPLPRDGRGPDGPRIGASWYLYDGDTKAFRESLARAEEFLLRVLDEATATCRVPAPGSPAVDLGRVALLGFSQGAYLAGWTAVRHPDRFRAAVLVAGRLKVEALEDALPRARGLPLLGLHGSRDESVRPGPSRESLARAAAAGLAAESREFDAGHEFTPEMRAAAREWLGKTMGSGLVS